MITNINENERKIEEFIAQFLIESFYELDEHNFVTASLSGTTSQVLAQTRESEQPAIEYLEFDDRPPFKALALDDIRHAANCKRNKVDYLYFNEKQGDARNVYIPDNLTKITFKGFLDKKAREVFSIPQTNVEAWNDGLEKMFERITFNGYSNISYSAFYRILYPYSLAYKLMSEIGFEIKMKENNRDIRKILKINEMKSLNCYKKALTILSYAVARVMTINKKQIESNAEVIMDVTNCDKFRIEHEDFLKIVALTTAANKMNYDSKGYLFTKYEDFIRKRYSYIKQSERS